MVLLDVSEVPRAAKQQHGALPPVLDGGHIKQSSRCMERIPSISDPARCREWQWLKTRLNSVFSVESKLRHLKLQLADGGKYRLLRRGINRAQDLHRAFLFQLSHAFLKLLALRRIRITQVGEDYLM